MDVTSTINLIQVYLMFRYIQIVVSKENSQTEGSHVCRLGRAAPVSPLSAAPGTSSSCPPHCLRCSRWHGTPGAGGHQEYL